MRSCILRGSFAVWSGACSIHVGGSRCRIVVDQWAINREPCAVYPEVALLCGRAPEVYCGFKLVTNNVTIWKQKNVYLKTRSKTVLRTMR